MISTGFVSIVLPVYNGKAFIVDAIDSIMNQTYQNFELVISDDSENDHTYQLIKKFPDTRIRYIKNESGVNGIFGNLNNAIKNSTGELIQIFCQDDVMYGNFLEKQIKNLSQWPEAGMVFCQFDYINATGIYPLEKRHDIRKSWPEYIHSHSSANYLLAYGCMPGNLSPVMLRRRVLEEIGFFNQDFSYAGDFEYWSRMAGKYSFVYDKVPGLCIRRHNQQASGILGYDKVFKDRQLIYQELLKKQTIQKSNSYLKWYINQEIGAQQLYAVLKNSLLLKGNFFELFKIISKQPLNILKSAIMMILTLNGRLRILKLSDSKL